MNRSSLPTPSGSANPPLILDTHWVPPMEHDLGPELRELANSFGAAVVRVTPITALRTGIDRRATFRLTLADGRVFKARRLVSRKRAELVCEIVNCLPQNRFSAIVARQGAALLEQWIEGPSLAELPVNALLARRCGSLLGAVHRTASDDRWGSRRRSLKRRVASFREELDELRTAGVLRRETAWALECAALEAAPSETEWGFTHRDFCPENLVLHQGRPCGIDNALVAFQPCDEDLARTCYRWPMRGLIRTAFFAGYAAHRSPLGFLNHATFWMTIALTRATLFRWRSRAERLEIPLQMLQQMVKPAEPRADLLWWRTGSKGEWVDGGEVTADL